MLETEYFIPFPESHIIRLRNDICIHVFYEIRNTPLGNIQLSPLSHTHTKLTPAYCQPLDYLVWVSSTVYNKHSHTEKTHTPEQESGEACRHINN